MKQKETAYECESASCDQEGAIDGGSSRGLLIFKPGWGTFKTPDAQVVEMKSESLELNFKTLEMNIVLFENLAGEKPLRGQREVIGVWEGGARQRQLMEGGGHNQKPKSAPAVP